MPVVPGFTFGSRCGILVFVAAASDGDEGTEYAVVVERQTRYLEGVVPTGREGSNPSDRTILLINEQDPTLRRGH